MPRFIKDDITAGLVVRLATNRGLSRQALRATHTLFPTTGAIADKSFFDDLSDTPIQTGSVPRFRSGTPSPGCAARMSSRSPPPAPM